MSSIKLQKWVYNLLCMDTFAHLSCLLPLQIRQRQFTCQIECAKLFIPLHYFFHQISQKFDLSTFKEQCWWCGFTVGLLSTQSLKRDLKWQLIFLIKINNKQLSPCVFFVLLYFIVGNIAPLFNSKIGIEGKNWKL